jgi:hypothetical protein
MAARLRKQTGGHVLSAAILRITNKRIALHFSAKMAFGNPALTTTSVW